MSGEGYAHVRSTPDGPCVLACPHEAPHFGSVPGVVGAGSAVKALPVKWTADLHNLGSVGDPVGAGLQEGYRACINDLRAAIAQDADRPELPFTLRMPTNRADNPDGADLNSGTQHVDVQVIHDPTMEKRGECRTGYGGPVIALREWDEQVFLHELLHAATGYSQPLLMLTHPPHGHEVICRIEVALWETGWRFQPTRLADRTSRGGALTEDERTLVDGLTALTTEWEAVRARHGLGPSEHADQVDRIVSAYLAARAARPSPDDQAEGER